VRTTPTEPARSLAPPGRFEKGTSCLVVWNWRRGVAESAITLEASEGEGILEVFQLGGRDEDGGGNASVRQGDVLVLGGPASELAQLAPCLSDGIDS
jgi:hypothetical protein